MCDNNWYIFCREVLAALKDKHDTNHSMIATAFHNLAVINSDQGKLSEALKHFEQALQLYEDNLGGNHPKVVESLRNIAKVHLDMVTQAQLLHVSYSTSSSQCHSTLIRSWIKIWNLKQF